MKNTQETKSTANLEINRDCKLWWSQVDVIRTKFLNPNDEVLKTFALAEDL
jgi:hypothetical protein